MTDKWSLIIETYKKAKDYLWNNKSDKSYSKNNEIGRLYLYEAYYAALREEKKEHLWYGRILFAMYEQNRSRYNEQMVFHFFLNKAYHEYILAQSENKELKISEMDQIERAYKKSSHYVKMQNSCKEQHKEYEEIIGGISLPEEFVFHGSKIISFQHDANSALLKLHNHDMIVTLEFNDVCEIKADLSPSATFVSNVLCFRYPDSRFIFFDIGFYKILCSGIKIKEITKNNNIKTGEFSIENSPVYR